MIKKKIKSIISTTLSKQKKGIIWLNTLICVSQTHHLHDVFSLKILNDKKFPYN